jgi:phosphoribosylformylglycinamidine cyclo-ligase
VKGKRMAKYDVNISLANEVKREMSKSVALGDPRILSKFGAFSCLYDFKFDEYENPVLVLKTEEPGSKQLIAVQYDKIENICYDMINHLINDCIVMGAKPLTVQDAIICGKLDKDIVTRIVKTVSTACKEQGCLLTGGETSEQPGVLGDDTYILTSSIVGVVDKKNIIDGSKISEGDIVIALESSGIHTNGYTLARTVMKEHPEIIGMSVNGKTFVDAILEPHRCYYNILKDLFGTNIISGLAHITGGGICENLNRILPDGVDAEIDLDTYKVMDIFKLLRKVGEISDEEMLRTFNLGVGIAAVIPIENVNEFISHVENKGVKCNIIGKIIKGEQQVICKGNLNWE